MFFGLNCRSESDQLPSDVMFFVRLCKHFQTESAATESNWEQNADGSSGKHFPGIHLVPQFFTLTEIKQKKEKE